MIRNPMITIKRPLKTRSLFYFAMPTYIAVHKYANIYSYKPLITCKYTKAHKI